MKKLVLPNVRKLFLADPGYTMYEGDLKGADAQVVAWEAEDEDLMAAFRRGLDVHSMNAEAMWGTAFTSLSGHARDVKRQQNKVAVHLTNYGGSSRTLAITQGWLVHEADRWQKKWFGLHPKIKTKFHGKVRRWLEQPAKTIWNAFGFRRPYFDRAEDCFSEALAWIAQSTVAINCNKGFFAFQKQYPQVEELLQTHDSVTFQVPDSSPVPVAEIPKWMTIKTPYPSPLFIPWDLKGGRKSWGELEKIKTG